VSRTFIDPVDQTWTLDGAGNPLETRNYYGAAGELFKTRAEQARAVVGGAARTGVYLTTYYAYNTDGSVNNQRQAATNRDGTTVHASYGNGTTLEYDNLGRVVKQTKDNGRAEETAFAYDVFGFRTSMSDPRGNVTTYVPDALGRVTSESIVGYGARTFDFDSFGNLTESTNRNEKTIRYTYDFHGRRVLEEWVGGNYTAGFGYTPLGELQWAENTGAAGVVSRYDYRYDAARRLEKATEKLRPLGLGTEDVVDFIYANNLLGQVTGVTANLPGAEHDYQNSYDYDNVGRMVKVIQQGSSAESTVNPKTVTFDHLYRSYAADGAPVLTTLVRRRDTTGSGSPVLSTKQNDFLGGGTSLIHHYQGDIPGSTADDNAVIDRTIRRVFAEYDPRNLLVEKQDAGWDGSGAATTTTTNAYDHFGQLTESTTTKPNEDPSTQTFEYDENGNRLGDKIGSYNRLTSSLSTHADYYYDAEGNVTAKWNYQLVDHVEDPGGNDEFELHTTSLGSGIYRLVFTDVVVDMQTFDIALWNLAGTNEKLFEKTRVTATPVGDGTYVLNATLYFELTQAYENGDFDVHFNEGVWDPSILSGDLDVERFDDREKSEWDYRNRLVKVKKYTTLGNPNTNDIVTMTFPDVGERTVYLTTSKEYLYDVHDQLIHTETYNETGPTRAVSESRTHVYERGHVVVEMHDGSTADETMFRLYGQNVDMPLAVDRPDAVGNTWTLTDHQGTVRDLVGHFTDGSLRHEEVAYTPFGAPTDLSGLPAGVSTFYAGRDLDPFTGLYNNRARWYDAGSGRFISEDPIPSDTNPYRYAGNSPANATDPSGRIVNVAVGAGVGAVVGAGGYLLHAWFTGQDVNWTDLGIATAAGMASGALAGATLGASLLVQGALAGATYGAINSGFTTAAHTGDWGEAGMAALQGGATGAVAGAVGGVVGGRVLGAVGQNFVGYAASGFAAGVSAGGVGGGLGGYMQTGTLGGALYGSGLGMLEGSILGGATGGGLYVTPKVAAGTSRFVRGFGGGFSASVRARAAAYSLEGATGTGMEAIANGIRQGVRSVLARKGPVQSRHYSTSPEGLRLHEEAQAYRAVHPEGANPNRNFATADVIVDGIPRIVRFKNDPGGMHSEQRLVAWEAAMQQRGRTVQVRRVYSERRPCGPWSANCAVYGGPRKLDHDFESNPW